MVFLAGEEKAEATSRAPASEAEARWEDRDRRRRAGKASCACSAIGRAPKIAARVPALSERSPSVSLHRSPDHERGRVCAVGLPVQRPRSRRRCRRRRRPLRREDAIPAPATAQQQNTSTIAFLWIPLLRPPAKCLEGRSPSLFGVREGSPLRGTDVTVRSNTADGTSVHCIQQYHRRLMPPSRPPRTVLALMSRLAADPA